MSSKEPRPINKATEHPIIKWWRESSEWCTNTAPTPDAGMAEGRLAINAWNAAIEQACRVVSDHPYSIGLRIEELRYDE